MKRLMLTMGCLGVAYSLLFAQNVGINTTTPTSTLDVNGTTTTKNLKVTGGATKNYILQSDANGNALWTSPYDVRYNVCTGTTQVPTSATASDFYSTGITLNGAEGTLQSSSFLSLQLDINYISGKTLYDFYLVSPSGLEIQFTTGMPFINATFRSDLSNLGYASPVLNEQLSGEFGIGNFGTNYRTFPDLYGQPINGEWKIRCKFKSGNTSGVATINSWSLTIIEDTNPFNDNLGKHTATQNIQLGAFYLNKDGGNEGLSFDDSGNATFSGKTTTSTFQLPNGATNGYFLKSDASGNASWSALSTIIHDNGSNVGIGTSSLPSESTLVLGGSASTEGGQLQINSANDRTKAYFLDNYDNSFRLMSGTNTGSNTVLMSINQSGNMGIATTTPKSTFEVNGSMAATIKVGLVAGATNLDETATYWQYTNSTGINPIISLPSASSCPNRIYTIVNASSVAQAISTFKNLSNTDTASIPASASITIVSNGSAWFQVR
jgi:hypothetical protein